MLFSLGNTAQRLCVYCVVRFFVRLYNEDAARLSPCKDELCNMTGKMQARHVQNPINGLCAVLPLVTRAEIKYQQFFQRENELCNHQHYQ